MIHRLVKVKLASERDVFGFKREINHDVNWREDPRGLRVVSAT